MLTFGVLTAAGKISPWTGRFYSLLDPSYAKNNIPIIASVSEHQPTTWSSFYFDLQMLVFMFPVGLYYCFSRLTDANIFIIMYGVSSIYFAVCHSYIVMPAILHFESQWNYVNYSAFFRLRECLLHDILSSCPISWSLFSLKFITFHLF